MSSVGYEVRPDVVWAKPTPPFSIDEAQVRRTRDVYAGDFVYDANGRAYVSVTWEAAVSLRERLKVMRKLCDLYNTISGESDG